MWRADCVLEFLDTSREVQTEDLSLRISCAPAAEFRSVDADFDTNRLEGDEEEEEGHGRKQLSRIINPQVRAFSQGELNGWGKQNKLEIYYYSTQFNSMRLALLRVNRKINHQWGHSNEEKSFSTTLWA